MRGLRIYVVGGLMVLSLSMAGCSASKTTSGGTAAGAPAASGATGKGGSTPAANSGGKAVDVCSLMTSAQASTINQVTYGAATPQHVAAGYDTCTYANTGKHVSPIDIQGLTVSVTSVAGCYAQLQSTEGPGKNIAGLGDAAFGYEIGIVVKSGDRCLEVSGLTDAELMGNYAPDTAMAKIILPKLH